MALLCLLTILCLGATAADKPNVIIFFIDDMGYSDVEPFGSTINKTPHLNRLAAEGIKFTQFYNASTACTPSRAALLSGCCAERVDMHGKVCFPNKDKALNPKEYLMSEMFRDAGYATGIFGKWHLGHLPGYLPPSHGFDEYLGIPYSNDMWAPKENGRYPPLPIVRNETPVAVVTNSKDQALLTRAFTDAALDFIRRNKAKDFFAFIPYAAVHTPAHGHPDFRSGHKNNLKAQVEEIDHCVGQVLELLGELEIDDNTLILFLSDNGGRHGTMIAPLNGGKMGLKYEGHQRTCFIARWPRRIPRGAVSHEIAITTDLLPTLCRFAGGNLSGNVIDGRDVATLLLDPESAKSPHEYVHYSLGQGIRHNQWKLLASGKGKAKALFNLDDDLGETNNLMEQYPEVVNRLQARLAEWRQTVEKQRRPHAKMSPVRPLVSRDHSLPTLADWMTTRARR